MPNFNCLSMPEGKRVAVRSLRSWLRMRADDMGDDGVHAGVLGRVIGDDLALTQDDDAVRDPDT